MIFCTGYFIKDYSIKHAFCFWHKTAYKTIYSFDGTLRNYEHSGIPGQGLFFIENRYVLDSPLGNLLYKMLSSKLLGYWFDGALNG